MFYVAKYIPIRTHTHTHWCISGLRNTNTKQSKVLHILFQYNFFSSITLLKVNSNYFYQIQHAMPTKHNADADYFYLFFFFYETTPA